MIKSYHPTKQPINKRTYAVHTYPQSHHVSHHVLINKPVHARMHGGYADTAGNGPTQSRLTLFARSLEDLYYYKQAYAIYS